MRLCVQLFSFLFSSYIKTNETFKFVAKEHIKSKHVHFVRERNKEEEGGGGEEEVSMS